MTPIRSAISATGPRKSFGTTSCSTAPTSTSPRGPSSRSALVKVFHRGQLVKTHDRLVATSYQLVIEGESYRRRQRPTHASTGVS